jgi:hypothetical protein
MGYTYTVVSFSVLLEYRMTHKVQKNSNPEHYKLWYMLYSILLHSTLLIDTRNMKGFVQFWSSVTIRNIVVLRSKGLLDSLPKSKQEDHLSWTILESLLTIFEAVSSEVRLALHIPNRRGRCLLSELRETVLTQKFSNLRARHAAACNSRIMVTSKFYWDKSFWMEEGTEIGAKNFFILVSLL